MLSKINMLKSVNESIKIKGKNILRGNIFLSGDPLASIFYITLALFEERVFRIRNVPRCKLFLDFLLVLNNLGVLVSWEDESTVIIDGKQEIKESLVDLYAGYDYAFVTVLIPLILKRHRECLIHYDLRAEAKFFRELGVLVKSNNNVLYLKLPLDINFEIKKNFNLLHADPFTVASRLFTSKIFKNLSVGYDRKNTIYDFNNVETIDIEGVVELKSSYNQSEFNLYASISSFSNGEVILSNFNLSESLDFLLSIDELGFRYEVSGPSMKVWYVGSDIEVVLDWTGHSFNNLCHLILLLSKTTNKTARVVCLSYPKLDDLITDLNIMGCRIESEQGKRGYSLLTIKSPSAFSSVKNDINDLSIGSTVIAFACCYIGNSRISGFNVVSDYMPYLIENLASLNVDISNK